MPSSIRSIPHIPDVLVLKLTQSITMLSSSESDEQDLNVYMQDSTNEPQPFNQVQLFNFVTDLGLSKKTLNLGIQIK